MKELKDVRREIDGVDRELADLIRRRLALADEVAAVKAAAGTPVADPAREREILTNLSKQVGDDFARGVRMVYSSVFAVSKARQRVRLAAHHPFLDELSSAESTGTPFPTMASVACACTEGSYAQQAALRLFEVPSILCFNGFEKVFEAVENGMCQYGVLPVENSSAGSVTAVYDLMQRHRFHIVRGIWLKVLADGAADSACNYTRFICISQQLAIYPTANKFALMLSLPHRPGALSEVIAKFAAIGVNLTKLESRPVLGSAFEFRFVFEFESAPSNPEVRALLAELATDPEIDHFTFLGAYEECRQ